jgi:ribonuclease Z
MSTSVLARLIAAATFALCATPSHAGEAAITVRLLGTGGPELSPHRLGYATLVEANGQKLLFDAGRGVTQRIYESRINPKGITRIFLTHLHNDHIEGLATLWMTPWFLLGRQEPFELWGPAGTATMIEGMRTMYAHDLEHRVNPFNNVDHLAVKVGDLKDGTIYDRDGVRVTAFSVEHADGNPAFGYRVDHGGHSVVLSGDTTYSENVVKYGTNVDLIVHNVIAFSDRLAKLPEMQGVLAKLTTPEQAAEVFNKAQPRMAVFSHIVKKELHGDAGDAAVLDRTRRAGYAGPLEMGHDRTVIEIGDDITVVPPLPTDDLPDLDGKAATF